MVKNQLFRVLPDTEIIQTLLEAFGLTSLEDNKFFTKQTLQDNETTDKLTQIQEKLESYYIPCKAKYSKDLTEKKCITLLRQFIKVHGYTLISKERYINRKKVYVYRLIKEDEKEVKPKKSKSKDIVISFD
tara:strand:+ start:2868 stop:3260 length:393 start_codon:yes stop_codon:yes gene_type:complete